MLIGVNGFKSAGKDTVGEYLVEQYDFKKVSFATLLKQSAAALFDVPIEKWEEWKNNDYFRVVIAAPEGYSSGNVGSFIIEHEYIANLSVREFLQRYGTESHRDVFGYDFWVEQAFKNLDLSERLVFTDARFENELKTIRSFLGVNLQILRNETDKESGGHVSEVRPNDNLIDAVIENNGTRDQLYDQVDLAFGKFFPNEF